MKNLLRLIFISRPAGYLLKIAVYMAGAVAGSNAFSLPALLGAFYMTFPMGILVYGLNDIADRESDEMNDRKGGIHGAVIKRNESKSIVIAAAVSYVSLLLFLMITRRFGSALAWTGIGLFGYTYSIRPVRLKSRPVFDSLSNGIWALCIVMTGFWISARGLHLALPSLHIILAIVWCTAAVHALGSLPDYDVDKAAGDRTIAVYFGKPVTYAICAATFAGVALLARSHLAYVVYMAICTILCVIGVRFNKPKIAKYIFMAVIIMFPLAFLARLVFNA